MKNKKSSTGLGRTRNWTFIIYPTEGNPSAPENWREILDEEHLKWIESPLHDKDITATGEPKKAHIHILVLYDGVKSYEQVKELADKLNAPIPKKVNNTKALVRYMAHLDDANKAQYDKNKIIGHGGVDVSEYLLTQTEEKAERHRITKEILAFAEEHNIVELTDIVDIAIKNNMDEWYNALCDNSCYFVNEVLRSRRHRTNRRTAVKYDPETNTLTRYDKETGEILTAEEADPIPLTNTRY